MSRSATLGGSVLELGENGVIRDALHSAPLVWWEMCFQDRERGKVGCDIQPDL